MSVVDEDGLSSPFYHFLMKLSTLVQGQLSTSTQEKIKNLLDIIKSRLLASRAWDEHVCETFARLTREADNWLERNDQSASNDSNRSIDASDPLTEERQKFVDEATRSIEGIVDLLPPYSPPPHPSTNTSKGKGIWTSSTNDYSGRTVHIRRRLVLSPAALQVSYDDLELQLRYCLLSFSVFPENEVIKKRFMIYWWIGEGFVEETRDKTAEEVGEFCFDMLISSGLIEPICQKPSKYIQYCKLQPSVRKMLISNAKLEKFFDFDESDLPTCDSSKCQRACLTAREEKQQQEEEKQAVPVSFKSEADKLISIFNISAEYIRCEKDTFKRLNNLSVLHLGRWQTSLLHHIEVHDTDFFDCLGVLKNLKYLSLRGISWIRELPDSVAGLTNLQILDLRACHNLETLTPKIKFLTKLTHLDVSESYLLQGIPEGVGDLSHLQVVKGFLIRDLRSQSQSLRGKKKGRKLQCSLSKLADLKNLRKLSINITSGAERDEDLKKLSNFTALRSLTISWICSPAKASSSVAIEAMTVKSTTSSPRSTVSSPLAAAASRTPSLSTRREERLEKIASSLSPPSSPLSLKRKLQMRLASRLSFSSSSVNRSMSAMAVKKPSITTIGHPPNLEKLNLQCIPDDETPDWLNPSGFQNLKRLHIIGGRLSSLNFGSANEGTWRVEMLRLKHLKKLNSRWPDFKSALPDLVKAQIYDCQLLVSPPPLNEMGVWMRSEEKASSSYPPSTSSS